MNVRFCPDCRSLILADFRFCPYCGAVASRGPDLSEAVERPFERIYEDRARGHFDIFAAAEESLDRLESDMDLILEALEKEGRTQGGAP